MNTLSKRLLAAALSGAILIPTIVTAEAGPRHGWRDRGGHHHHNHRPARHHRKHKNNNAGAAIAAGVIGLAAGAILLSATRQPAYAGPPRAPAYPPAPYPGHVYGPGAYQPWGGPVCTMHHINGHCVQWR